MADYGTNAIQQGDVYHFHGSDGGDIEVANGFVTMTAYIETAVYYCLMGGNEKDDGSAAMEREQFWGNEGEPKERQLRGRLQSMFDGRSLTSARLSQYEEAARNDIKNGMPSSVVASVSVSASIPEPKRLDLAIEVTTTDGTVYKVNLGFDA